MKITKESLDQETQQILSEGENWSLFIKGEMWQKVRKMMEENIKAVDSIHSLNGTEEKIRTEIKARKLATEMVKEWITEIEGLGQQYDVNKITKIDSSSYIVEY